MKKKLKDCEVWTMERWDGSWVASVESPTASHISVMATGETEKLAIKAAKQKWKINYK